jgi:radical SAM superfamily enzyme YgiQ (UPF0313 family)
MNALLVYPEFPDTYWSFKHALPFAGKRAALPPLGLMTISSMLPSTWQKRLVDMNVRALTEADLKWADIVFASAMIVQQDSLRDVINRCKELDRRLAVGGPFVSTGVEHVADVDHLFIGEAETILPEFLSDLASGLTQHIYRSDKKPDLTLTPVPDVGLIDMRYYSSMAVQYSRGCPFNCEFCDIIEIYGRVPRTKTNQQMLAEFDALYDAGWRGSIFIVDDNFIGNKKNVKKLMPDVCEWMERHQHPFRLYTEASVNLADDDALLDLMKRANFRKVFLGIETPVEESLKEAQKGQNTKRSLLDSVRKIQSYGIEVMAGFIVGFDHDPADIFQRQIDFIRQSAIPMAIVGLLTALPETQLWRRLHKEGRLLMESTSNHTDGTLNFIPTMDRQTLLEGYQRIVRTIYNPAEYYERAHASLKNTLISGFPATEVLTMESLLSLFRILFKLGLVDTARKEFWRFLLRVYSVKRGLIPDALVLAATGYHVRKITEQYCGPTGR